VASSVLKLAESDDAAAARPVARGGGVEADGQRLMTVKDIPAGHKLTLHEFPEAAQVRRYDWLEQWEVPAAVTVQVIGRVPDTVAGRRACDAAANREREIAVSNGGVTL